MTKHNPRTNRERRISTDSAISASIATQVALGRKPSHTLAAKIAGIAPSTASEKTRTEAIEDSIDAALARVGITDNRLAEVAGEGLESYDTRVISKDGVVTDERQVPDFAARHKFWRDLMMVKGYLGADRETSGGMGGLIIVHDAANTPGHQINCACDECITAWNAKAAKVREEQQRRHERMEREYLPLSANAVQPVATNDEDDYDDWTDREEQ